MLDRKGRSEAQGNEATQRLAELPRILARREWIVAFRGHEIRVKSHWLGMARLTFDGKEIDRRLSFLSLDPRRPLLAGRLMEGGTNVTIVEAYFNLPLATRLQVRVDGRRVHAERVSAAVTDEANR